MRSGIIQTALYFVLSRFIVYLLKLLWISATWEESLSIPQLIPSRHVSELTAITAEKPPQLRPAQSSALFGLITWLHNRPVEAHQTCLASLFPRRPSREKPHTCERLPCQELAHVAQLTPQWTGGWAWCHPLPHAASPAPYKDLHHMVPMVLSLLAQVGCFSKGVGLCVSCWGRVRSDVWGNCF